MTPTSLPRQSTGTDRKASKRSSGRLLSLAKRGSLDALAQRKGDLIHNVCVRIFRRPQNKLVAVQHIDEAGVAVYCVCHQLDNAFQYGVKRISSCHAAADLMQQIDITQGERSLFFLGQGPSS